MCIRDRRTDSPCRTCDIWQNSDSGKVNGINGNVDTDIIFNADYKGSSATTITTPKYSGIKAVQAWVGTTVDGIYGPDTKKHLVMKLQEELNRQFGMNLIVDGIYGVGTHNAIVVLSYGCRGNLTKVLQGLLICKGYDTNGFDGIYDAQITSYDEALVNDEKKYDYPEEAQTLLKNVKTYASSAGVSIYNMSGIDSLNMFESRTIDQIDFSTTKLLSKI